MDVRKTRKRTYKIILRSGKEYHIDSSKCDYIDFANEIFSSKGFSTQIISKDNENDPDCTFVLINSASVDAIEFSRYLKD